MNHPIPLPLKGTSLFIDNSGMTTYMSCPRKGAYSFSLKRKPAKTSAALLFGAAIHESLEVRYRDFHHVDIIDDEVFDAMVQAFIQYYQDSDEELDTNEYRNISYGIQTLSEYVTQYRYEPNVTHCLPSGEPCVEIPFALPVGQLDINDKIWVSDPDLNNGQPTIKHIDTITIYLTGKIDMIVKDGKHLWLLDHKTTSMGGATYFDEFYTSTQFKGYKWAAEKLLDHPIQGVIINAMVCRPPKKDGSTNYDLTRAKIPIHSDHVDEWENTFLTTVSEFVQQHVDQTSFTSPEQSFPMNTMWCKAKYGTCPFYETCTLRPSQREQFLFSNLYTSDRWSPIKEEQRVNLGQTTDLKLPNGLPLS